MIDNNPWADFSKSRNNTYNSLRNKIKTNINEIETKTTKDKKQSNHKKTDRDRTLDVYG